MKTIYRTLLAAWSLLTACLCQSIQGAELRAGQALTWPGTTVSIPVTCSDGPTILGAQLDVGFASSVLNLANVSLADGLDGHLLDKREIAAGHWRVLIYSSKNATTSQPTLAWLNFTIAEGATNGIYPVVITNAIIPRQAGQRLQPLQIADGSVQIVVSEYFLSLSTAPGGAMRAAIFGPPGRVLALQGTPDLFHWADLGDYTNTGGLLLITNSPPGNYSAYFYRTAFRHQTNQAQPAPDLFMAQLTHFNQSPDGANVLVLEAPAGSTWRLEGSPDQFHWGDYGLLVCPGTLVLTNSPLWQSDSYYYRAVAP